MKRFDARIKSEKLKEIGEKLIRKGEEFYDRFDKNKKKIKSGE